MWGGGWNQGNIYLTKASEVDSAASVGVEHLLLRFRSSSSPWSPRSPFQQMGQYGHDLYD